jgi:hypothetical protein
MKTSPDVITAGTAGGKRRLLGIGFLPVQTNPAA